MNEEQSRADLLYVGLVYVDVGYAMPRGPTAETIDWLGATDLGGTIRVDLIRYAFDDDDLYEGDPPHGSVGMWKMLLTEMRDMLARCFIFGEMKVVGGERLSTMLDEEQDRNLEQAITELGDEKFLIKITPEIAVKALKKRARDEQALKEGLQGLASFIEAQQDHPGENITLEEAGKRHQEGMERLKRIAEEVPEVVNTEPINGATGVDKTIQPKATFNTDLDASTVNAQNVRLELYNSTKQKWVPVSSTPSYDQDTKAITVTPATSLGSQKEYRVTLSTSIKSSTYEALASPYSWSYTTAR